MPETATNLTLAYTHPLITRDTTAAVLIAKYAEDERLRRKARDKMTPAQLRDGYCQGVARRAIEAASLCHEPVYASAGYQTTWGERRDDDAYLSAAADFDAEMAFALANREAYLLGEIVRPDLDLAEVVFEALEAADRIREQQAAS